MTSLKNLLAPVVEPLSFAEVKQYLRLDGDAEDSLIDALIRAARVAAETYTGRAFITQSWQLFIDRWPANGVLLMPLPPLQTIMSIVTLGPDGGETTVSADQYWVDGAATPGRVVMRPSCLSPMPGKSVGGIRVDFKAGYGDDWNMVPETLRLGMLQYVAHLYENRGGSGIAMPLDVIAMWRPYRLVRL